MPTVNPPLPVRFCSLPAAVSRATVVACLAAAGLEPDADALPAAGDCVLLVTHAIDAAALEAVQAAARQARVLLLTVSARAAAPDGLWAAMAAGASDVVQWRTVPARGDEIASRIDRWRTVRTLAESPAVERALIGHSAAWRALVQEVVEIATFSQSAVLVCGESGTGKELIARLVHALDPRPAKRELVVVDCTTIASELSGSEFFGHERGAFTGAVAPRDGAFMLAHGGTLFLDEIGELPMPMQAQLLRVIQEGKFKRIGSNTWQETRFRLVAATHRDLEAGIAAGTFRADLYHRIAGWVCRTPPLSERVDDVMVLARHFQAEFSGSSGCTGFDDTVGCYLTARAYPGNVRDLRRLVARLCHRHAGPGPITVGDVPPDERPTAGRSASPWHTGDFRGAIHAAVAQGLGLKAIGQAAEDTAIDAALAQCSRNVQRAADRLGVTTRTLQLRRAGREA